ncbi:Metallophos domain-containing protein [Aphelenchoides besseyi]|nr:Metallophos domain-containing protein [Aphelenchoides besseyi]KAI6202069.1 Metallophos domain-containing protein [Aphelenchoides besseyi]
MTVEIAVDSRTADQHELWTKFWSNERVCKPYDNPLNLNEPIRSDFVRIVCISDTHEQLAKVLNRIPNGDILVHTGDFTNNGEKAEILKFDEEIGQLPHLVKLVVCGNHELGFDDIEDISKRPEKTQKLGTPKGYKLLKNCTVLHDKLVEMSFHCFSIRFLDYFRVYGFSFSCTRGEQLLEKWKKIPNDVDILLTHTPPLGHSDVFRDGVRWGDADLLNVIEKRVQPKLHVFGHVHEQNGMTTNGDTVFVNASICDHQLNPRFNPIVFDIPLPAGHTKDRPL